MKISEKEKRANKAALEKRRTQFYDTLRLFADKYDNEMLEEFFLYWSEANAEGTAMRWQKQPTFNLRMRLQTWAKRVKDFKKRNNGNKNYRKPLNREERLQEEARMRQQQYQEGFDILTGRSPQLPPDGGSAVGVGA